jgi:hypothetical protein
MAQRKKSRQTDFARQKIEERQRRNEYFKRFRVLCDMIHPDLYPMLDTEHKMIIYEMRGLPIKVVADGKMDKELLDSITELANLVQKDEVVPLGIGGHKISLTDYHRYISPLEWFIRPGDEECPNICLNPDRFKGLKWYEDFFSEREVSFMYYHIEISKMLVQITSFASDLRYSLFCTYFETEKAKPHKGIDMKQRGSIHIQPIRTDRKRIKLPNGDMRNAMRLMVAMPSESLQPLPENLRHYDVSFSPSHFGMKGPRAKIERPVYISEHALNRLDERMGCICPGYMQMFLCISLMNGAGQYLNDGRLLVDFIAFKKKIGYLVLSIQRNSILVHTFLLITASSTPEGKKLREQFGIQKADSLYLGIDKLSTFIHSNILQHEDVCELFRTAGCGSLLEVCEVLKNDELWQQDGEQIRLAERVREYLKKGDPEEVWVFAEEDGDDSNADAEEVDTEGDDGNTDAHDALIHVPTTPTLFPLPRPGDPIF